MRLRTDDCFQVVDQLPSTVSAVDGSIHDRLRGLLYAVNCTASHYTLIQITVQYTYRTLRNFQIQLRIIELTYNEVCGVRYPDIHAVWSGDTS